MVAVEAEDGAFGQGEVVFHEKAWVHGEASVEEDVVDDAGVVEEELGLDAIDVGGVQEQVEQVVEEGVGGAKGLGGVAAGGVGVADDGLVAFVDAEGETADAAAIEGDEAGEDTGVQILQEELGGAAIVPAETVLPDGGLGLEQGAELTRREVAEVEDLELGGGGHELESIPSSL